MLLHLNMQKNITPRFEFGFGLSYTSFHYTDLSIRKLQDIDDVQSAEIANWEAGNSSETSEGSSTALWYVPFKRRYKVLYH